MKWGRQLAGRTAGGSPAGSRRDGGLAGRPTTIAVMAMAFTAAAIRLIPLQFLQPLNWDEMEFFRATAWIAEGRVPFRDFWEHHTPLAWFVFAPVAAMTDSAGVGAIIALRWAQVPVWIATFWLANFWMRAAGLGAFARWCAMALALSSSMLMLPAVEFRIDSLACMLFMAGLVLVQRNAPFAGGIVFCLAGFANIRLGPLLALTVLTLRVVDPRARAWMGNPRMNRVFAGAAVAFGACLLYFAATGSLDDLYQQVWYENYLGDKYSVEPEPLFLNRVVAPFGLRVLGAQRLFDVWIIDPGGIAVLTLGFVAILLALLSFRKPDDLVVLALLHTASLVFIAVMKYVYNYHFEIVVVMAVPLMAMVIERVRWRSAVVAFVTLAWLVNAYASILRGKELDRAFQDMVMHEIVRRSTPAEKIFSGGPWALRREPAYHYWFLPQLAQRLVQYGHARPYDLRDVLRDPPAVIVADHWTYTWIRNIQRELAPYFVRHYVPVWRNLWVPGLNVALPPRSQPFEWIVPRDGGYRVFASAPLARHPWFRSPFSVGIYERADGHRLPVRLPQPAANPSLHWWIDRQPASPGAVVRLRKGQRIAVANGGSETLAIFLLPGEDTMLFRQPPVGVTLEAATDRVTHVPRFGVRIQP